MKRLSKTYFHSQDTVGLARDLLGKTLTRKFENGDIIRTKIIETEAYVGEEDLACHASKGRTKRTELMYHESGLVYVYLIYGMYWMLNFVTAGINEPEAILIRGIEACSGPGRVGRLLKLDKSFYGEDLGCSDRLWLEESELEGTIEATPRVGVDYAEPIWKNKPWRFVITPG